MSQKVLLRALSRRQILVSAFAGASAGKLIGGQWQPAPGQQPAAAPSRQQPTAPTFSTDVKVVNVFVTVRDKDNKIVRNLNKEDFALEEDGRPQAIRYFAQQSDLPLTVGLLVDTSMSERRMLGTERDASETFFQKVLRPDKDKAFLIHFDREVELLQDLTASREKLEKALDQIDKPQWGHGDSSDTGDSGGQNGGGYGRGGGRGGYGGRGNGGHGGTTLYDAVYLASDDLMNRQTGRKALILLTDGEDRGSKVSLSEAITGAQRADTLAYSMRIADEERESSHSFGGPGMGGRHGGWGGGRGRGGPYESRTDGKKILQQISKETGGSYFEVSKKKTVDEIYKQIEEELRNQYSLGYTSDQTSGGGFRKIQVTVKQKGYTVQAREGYYAS
jgi:VWFA-related protein